jgi:N-ethylmaleimide reductase
LHVGRIAHHLNRGRSADVVAPSAVGAAGQMFTDQSGMQYHDTLRSLTTDEIRDLAGQSAKAARSAIAVGCDGVELHSANG